MLNSSHFLWGAQYKNPLGKNDEGLSGYNEKSSLDTGRSRIKV